MFEQISFEMINHEFKVKGRKYQVLPEFAICCRELARSAPSCEFSRMRAQFLLCLSKGLTGLEISN